MNVEAIAAASPRIEALIFGPGDFAASLGVPRSVRERASFAPGDHRLFIHPQQPRHVRGHELLRNHHAAPGRDTHRREDGRAAQAQ